MFWKSFLDIGAKPGWREGGGDLPPGLHGVTSAAPCPPEVIEGLLSRGLLTGMTEIYGATEFGAVGLRRRCRGEYDLLPHWRRERFTAETGTEEWGIRRAGGTAMPLPDIVEWAEERRFCPVRRKDHAVQVGGVNVFPSRVEEALRAHPGVRDCAVRLMRPEEGVRLKAFVAPWDETLLQSSGRFGRELKIWLAERLEPAATPKTIRLGLDLPRTPSGKLADWDLSGWRDADVRLVEDANRKGRFDEDGA